MNSPHPNQSVEYFSEPRWGFDNAGPFYWITLEGAYDRVAVDPAPCYSHDLLTVRNELTHLQMCCPLPIPLKVAVLAHECDGRTNGHYANVFDYQNKVGDSYPPMGIIVMGGKRTPIHPAMTRYLLAHEYGHAVQYCLERKMGIQADAIEPLYCEQFRPNATQEYGLQKWHTNTGELFANDFRILVAMTETEFWPHEGYGRPEDISSLVKFWENVQDIFQGI